MIYIIIWGHFICDFILQTDAMARGKSSSNAWLLKHIAAYTGSLLVFLAVIGNHSIQSVLPYCLINGLAHFATDYATSRVTKRLWAEKRVHDFFVVIGLDQAIHMTTLLVTLPLIKGTSV